MALEQAVKTIRNRVDQFGVTEPDIRKQQGYRIQIQLPGLSDPRRAIQIIGKTAHLEFKVVNEDADVGKGRERGAASRKRIAFHDAAEPRRQLH